MPDEKYIEVAVALPLDDAYTYRLPEAFGEAPVGSRVLVPFGKRKITGYVLGPGKPVEGVEIKDIVAIMDDEPSFTPSLLKDLRWLADYYIAPIGETLKAALPAGINVESAASFMLTPDGESALADRKTSDSDRAVLAKIAADPGIARKKIVGGDEKINSALSRMVRAGWLFKTDKVAGAKVKPRSVSMASIAPNLGRSVAEIVESFGKRARAKARLVSYLDSTGEVAVPELNSLFPGASATIKALEAEGIVATRPARVWRDPTLGDVPELSVARPTLTKAQANAFAVIREAIDKRVFAPFLLHGVTGSGKTEVYLRAIEESTKLGRRALVLVPEIALTPQLVGRFRSRFGAEVAVLHSGMGSGERLDEWTRVRRNKALVAVGARSAVFAPFEDIGLIVVDEEHDGGYKQEDKITYNARDFALVRARSLNAVVVMGSATPSLESYRNAKSGRYGLLELPERVESKPLPAIEIVDLRESPFGRTKFMSQRLEDELVANFKRRRQTILFMNRRGFAPFVMCVECGQSIGCPSCSVSLTYHRGKRKMVCHFCDREEPPPNLCPNCSSTEVRMVGYGTERIEDEIRRIVPEANVARLDRDAVSKKGELARVLGSLRDGSLDILIGTQMVAKGHDYPGVTLVGVLLAESSLNFPDFRAAETTFALVTQVAGRAGRGDDPGKVVVQTYNPSHPAILRALNHDYAGFVVEEMANREELSYPPFSRMVAIRIVGPDPLETSAAAKLAADAARRCPGVRVSGPAPAPYAKIRDNYRWQAVIRGESSRAVRDAAKYVMKAAAEAVRARKSTITVDVDPMRLL